MELINSSVITAEEIVNKTLAHKNRKSMVWYILLMFLGVLGSFFLNLIFGVVLIVLCVIWIALNWYINKQILKQIKEANNVVDGIYFEYIFKDENFQIGSVCGEQNSLENVDYNALMGVRVFEDIMFLYITQNDAYIVKKSGFQNAEDWDTLIECFKEKNLIKSTN